MQRNKVLLSINMLDKLSSINLRMNYPGLIKDLAFVQYKNHHLWELPSSKLIDDNVVNFTQDLHLLPLESKFPL